MAKPKNIKNMVVSAELKGSKADIRIVDHIGEWSTSGSHYIRSIVDEMINGGATHADVYMNSRGGDIFEAVEIGNELSRFKTLSITVGSVAASAATYITSKFKQQTKAKKNSQFMIHRPVGSFSGDIVSLTARMKLLQNTTDEYKQTYATATGKTEEEIETMWQNGDYWMTAQEAVDQGFIGAVLEEEHVVAEDDVFILQACGAPQIPEITNITDKKSNDMDRNKLIAALGLEATATDEQIEAAAKSAKEDSAKLAQVEAKAASDNKAKAETLVAQAITDKKITADMKDHYVNMATANYDSVEAVFKGMQGVKAPEIVPGGDGPSGDDIKARASWTLDDYLEKAPEALAKMEQDDPEQFKKLNENYFGSNR